MMIKEDNKQATYELWYLGDRCNSLVVCRDSFNKMLIDAGELMRCGREAGLTSGGIEIVRVSADGTEKETVWEYNHADKGNPPLTPSERRNAKQPQQLERVRDYDKYWNVTGYYLDSEGHDIRDRD
jgi:hypothetical protein